MNFLYKHLISFLNRRAQKVFLSKVNYTGDINHLEILRQAHANVSRGSKSSDITIGDYFRFFGGSIVTQSGGKIKIGSHCQFGFNLLLGSVNSITIGDYALFADNITIMDNNNHPVNPLDRELMHNTDYKSDYRGWKYSASKPIVIGNNVWCGSNVRINKGVTIGDGAVIAACTVVTKDVPANSICAGNPGKIVKIDIDKLPKLINEDAEK